MTKNIVRVNKTKNYTVMSNQHLNDENLSWKAKGIHSYILSLPDDWKVIIEHLQKVSTDGERSTRSGIKELYESRYWQKYPIYINGKVAEWVTEIYEEPFPEEELIKSIVIKNGLKIINYVNQENKKDCTENDLLCQNVEVGEPFENSKLNLLCQNVEVGNVDVDKLNVENEGLLNTNNTNNSFIINTHSINHSKKEDERKNDSIEEIQSILRQANIKENCNPKEYTPVKRAIESLYFRNNSLNINNMSIPPSQIREDLKSLSYEHIEEALIIFREQVREQKINNRISYLATCIYNSIFDLELKIQHDVIRSDLQA